MRALLPLSPATRAIGLAGGYSKFRFVVKIRVGIFAGAWASTYSDPGD
jgi:hypothetical protein